MAGIEFSDIGDLVDAVFDDLDKDKVEQTQNLVDYPIVRMMAAAAKTGTTPHRTNIRLRETPSFKWVKLMETTANLRVDLMAKMTSEAIHSEEKVHYDQREEAFISKDATRILDHIKEQRNGAIQTVLENWDAALATAPYDANDEDSPKGLLYHIRPIAPGSVDYDGDFIGQSVLFQNGTTSSTYQGQDRSIAENTRLRNFAINCGDEYDAGFVRAVRLCRINVGFKSLPGVTANSRGQKVLVMGTTRYEQALDAASTARQVGPDGDIDAVGDPRLSGMKLVHAPALDIYDWLPVIGYDPTKVYLRKIPNFWLTWTAAVNSREGINIFTKALNCSGFTHGSNPREAGFVVHKPIAAA